MLYFLCILCIVEMRLSGPSLRFREELAKPNVSSSYFADEQTISAAELFDETGCSGRREEE